MKQQDTLVVGGVDAHADTHHAAALDERGALLATKSFPTTTPEQVDLVLRDITDREELVSQSAWGSAGR